MRLIVVEDDPLVAEGIVASLELIDHEVIGVAHNGKDALRLAREMAPDMLIMDINLPDLSGIEVVRVLEEDATIPCVFLTAYTDRDLINQASQLEGIYGYIVKPASEGELKAAIDIAMTRYKEKNELQASLRDAQKSLAVRKLVERAKGVLMDNMGLKEQDAVLMMRKRSNEQNKKMEEVAQDIIGFFGKGDPKK